jgi:hypothetical protein
MPSGRRHAEASVKKNGRWLIVAALGAFLAGAPLATSGQPGEYEPQGDRSILEDMKHYAAMGDHRTGGEVDRATSAWLADELLGAGMSEVRLVPFELRRFVLHRSVLGIGDHELDCFPLWFPRSTGSEPLIGPLAPLGEDPEPAALAGAIAYAELPEGRLYASFDPSQLIERAVRASARALVVMIPHPIGRVAAQNAVKELAETELGLPAVIVGAADRSLLRSAAVGGKQGSLLVSGEVVENGEALNVVGRIERGRLPWIVISTPSSGWFRCADERAPGIALWLALARWAGETDRGANFLFLAFSGHELGFAGGRRAFQGELPGPEEVALWIHLGAAIAVAEPLATLMTGPQDLREKLADRISGPFGMSWVDPGGVPPTSEMGLAIARGYPVLGLYGANRDIHLRSDARPTASAETLHRLAMAIAGIIAEQLRRAPLGAEVSQPRGVSGPDHRSGLMDSAGARCCRRAAGMRMGTQVDG